MKLVKIKSLPDADEVISWLVDLVKNDEMNTGSWPLALPSYTPDGNFYVVEDQDSQDDRIVMPAYIMAIGDEALVLWVDKSCRRKGYAKFMVNSLGIRYCVAIESSVPFWKSLGFKQLNGHSNYNQGGIRMKR